MNFLVVLIFAVLAALPILAADLRGDLTTKQMQYYKLSGFSCASHWGTWSDLLVLPWVMGMIWPYARACSAECWIAYFIAAIVASSVVHKSWINTNVADHNIIPGKRLTAAGHLHNVFMSAVIAFAAMFYFGGQAVATWHFVLVSVVFGLHVTVIVPVMTNVRLATLRRSGETKKGFNWPSVLIAAIVWVLIAFAISLR